MNILLVDDDHDVIQAILPTLTSISGAEVRVASQGTEALEYVEDWKTLDLLVTDVVMEPMDGFTLRTRLEDQFPGLKTIFISGYDLEDYAAQTAGCQVLVKPFYSESLRHALQSALPPVSAQPPENVEVAATGETLVGMNLGNYKIICLVEEQEWGAVYEALQTSMNRVVDLKVLSPKLRQNAAAREQFVADAQAKANVQHPLIRSVYEAGDSGPYCYYALEHMDGIGLIDYIVRFSTLSDPLALQIIRVTAEGLSYLDQNRIPHEPLDTSHLYIDANNRPRLDNPATHHDSNPDLQRDIVSLSQIIGKVLPDGRAEDPELQSLLQRMSLAGPEGFVTWSTLLETVKALEPGVMPAGAYKISEENNAGIRRGEESKPRQKAAFLASCAVVFLFLCASLFLAARLFLPPNERDLDSQVAIPAGEFIYQEGQKLNLPAFWIDQYEVTFGQYARFLKFAEKHRDEIAKFEHPDQPAGKSHKPKDWDVYYTAAKSLFPNNRFVNFIPIDLNCPVFGIDWYDAYAYAKWKGHRLPTEQEWEKAARGTDGRLYPWGNEFDPQKCNSAIDYNPDPRAGGNVDGFNRWSPVDAIKGDCSPFNVYGMAGNLSEWTGSWDPPAKFPVIRGGSYYSVDNTGNPDVKVTRRVTGLYPGESSQYLGFRTISNEPPKK